MATARGPVQSRGIGACEVVGVGGCRNLGVVALCFGFRFWGSGVTDGCLVVSGGTAGSAGLSVCRGVCRLRGGDVVGAERGWGGAQMARLGAGQTDSPSILWRRGELCEIAS